jgi:AcrR family transcriptional regulator
MSQPSRRERAEELRQRLVVTALELFAARGVAGTSLADVGEATGISKQLLLYHFKSKDTLKQAVVDHLIARSRADISGLLESLDTVTGTFGVESLLERGTSMIDSQPSAARMLMRLLLEGTAEDIARIVEGTRDWFQQLTGEIRRGQQEGRFRAQLDAEATVAQLGMLVLANFTLLPVHGWTDRSAGDWQRARLTELLRAIHAILVPG